MDGRRNSYLLVESAASDLVVACVMVQELEPYLLQDQLYRTITVPTGSGHRKQQMTLTDLFSRINRLQKVADELNPDEKDTLNVVHQQIAQIRAQYQAAFEARLLRELKAHLNGLRWFLDDCMAAKPQEMRRYHIDFPFEMRNRQRIEEALHLFSCELSAELLHTLHDTDRKIREVSVSAPFIWDKKLQAIYPNEPYWYLYRRPPLPLDS